MNYHLAVHAGVAAIGATLRIDLPTAQGRPCSRPHRSNGEEAT
jgi:hypothetical protein